MEMSSNDIYASLEQCVDLLNSYFAEVDVGKEVKAVHYSTVASCVADLLNLIASKLNELANAGVELGDDVYNQLSKCQNLVNSYAMPKSMSIIQPEHENMLIDMLKCVENLYYMLPAYILWVLTDSGIGADSGAYTDLTPILDRAYYQNSPIPYFTDQLTQVGGYVLTPPPPYTTAVIGSLQTMAWGLSLYIKNISKGWTVRWTDSSGSNPCAKVSVYLDNWVLAWIEDRCWSGADWDYNDMAVGVRAEVLDGATYLHVIFLDQDHLDTDQPCVDVQGATYCDGNIGSYSGSARIVWEAWIRISL
jgi:hypothetical protein